MFAIKKKYNAELYIKADLEPGSGAFSPLWIRDPVLFHPSGSGIQIRNTVNFIRIWDELPFRILRLAQETIRKRKR
jgi:hypothetical protein